MKDLKKINITGSLGAAVLFLASCSQSYEVAPLGIKPSDPYAQYPKDGDGKPIILGPASDSFRVDSITNKVDVLFVMDNSGSMSEEQTKAANSASKFIEGFVSKNIDYHIGVTSTDGRPLDVGTTSWAFSAYSDFFNAGPGSLLHSKSGPLVTGGAQPSSLFLKSDPGVADQTAYKNQVVDQFKSNIEIGTNGSGAEAGLVAVMNSLNLGGAGQWNEGFIRPDSLLGIVIISDEDESTNPDGVGDKFYIRADATKRADRENAFVNAVKASRPGRADLISFNAVVGIKKSNTCKLGSENGLDGTGDVYASVAKSLGGKVLDICSEFSDELGSLSEEIATQQGRRFPLSKGLYGSDGITVTLTSGSNVSVLDASAYKIINGTHLELTGALPPPPYSVGIQYKTRLPVP